MPVLMARIRCSSRACTAGVEAAGVAGDADVARDRVAGAVGAQVGAGQHGGRDGVDAAGDDVLQRGDDLRADHERVDDQVRRGGVPAAATHGDREAVLAGHDRPGAGVQVAGGEPGDVVQPVQAVDGEALEQPVVEHRLRAPAGLLRRLEQHPHGPVEPALLGERRGGGQHHRHVPVVAAGVHGAGAGGGVRDAAVLRDRQRVELAAQPDRPGTAAAGQRADDPGPADPGRDVEAEAAQHVGDVRGGLVLAERGLGDAVQRVAPLAGASGSGGHRASLGGRRGQVHSLGRRGGRGAPPREHGRHDDLVRRRQRTGLDRPSGRGRRAGLPPLAAGVRARRRWSTCPRSPPSSASAGCSSRTSRPGWGCRRSRCWARPGPASRCCGGSPGRTWSRRPTATTVAPSPGRPPSPASAPPCSCRR